MPNGAYLPEEIIVDILYRLPAKSLARFKCVSKEWCSLICDPRFIKTRLHRNKHHEKVIVISRNHSLHSITSSVPFDGRAIATEINFPSREFLGFCNGLILVTGEDCNTFLLNPTTKESKKVPAYPFDDERGVFYGLGYDSVSDDYKIVILSVDLDDWDMPAGENFVDVFTLRTNCWRSIGSSPYDHAMPENSLGPGVFVNGFLHWFGASDVAFVIAAFNLVDEKFREVPPPTCLLDYEGFKNLASLRGSLCMLGLLTEHIDVWLMKEYGVEDSWTKLTIRRADMFAMKPICLVGDGELALELDRENQSVCNSNEGTSMDMIHRTPYMCLTDGILTVFEGCTVGTFIESLVSPNCNKGLEGATFELY